jgi:hypothetical protein
MKAQLLAILMVLGLVSGVAFADETADATAHIFVDVTATVAVTTPTVLVDLGSIQATEPLEAILTFKLDCNLQTIDMQVLVTNLYKGDDGASEFWIPVLAKQGGVVGHGAFVQPANGNETFDGGADNWLAYTGTGSLNGCDGLLTESSSFESSTKGNFSQNVVVTVAWQELTNTELPVGEYSGWVQLTVMVPL